MSEEAKKSGSNETPSTQKPETKITEIKWINEDHKNIKNHHDRDIQKGFDFESKPTPPVEKPRTDSEKSTGE